MKDGSYGHRGQTMSDPKITGVRHPDKGEVRARLASVEGKDDKRTRPPISVPPERLDTDSGLRTVAASVTEATYQALRDFALARGVTRAQVTRAAIVAYLAGHSDPVFGTLASSGRSVAPAHEPEGMLLALSDATTDDSHAP